MLNFYAHTQKPGISVILKNKVLVIDIRLYYTNYAQSVLSNCLVLIRLLLAQSLHIREYR